MNTTVKPAPWSYKEIIGSAGSDFRRCFPVLAAFEAFFKLLTALVLLPSLAGLLFYLMRSSGRTAVTNTDILGFLLSPVGVLCGFLFGLKLLGILLLEQAGVVALVALKQRGQWHGLRYALIMLAGRGVRVLRLAALLLALAALVLAPFALLLALVYGWLLGDQDVNYYLAVRPPRFQLACVLGGVLMLSALAVSAYLSIRWAFALPIMLLEDRQPIPALRVSATRVRGAMLKIGLVLIGWQVIGLVLEAGGLALFKLLASGLLAAASTRPSVVVPLVAGLLVGQGVLLAALSSVVVVVYCLLLLRLYSRSARSDQPEKGDGSALDETPAKPGRLLSRLEWAIAGVVVAAGVAWLALTLPFEMRDNVQVTAHRGYSRKAPENTLAAIGKAIEVGADWAEIDVQQTKDGEIILLHDDDLKRMTGDPHRPGQLTLKEIKNLRLRKEVCKGFPEEKIPTLQEVIALARGKIKMNIELKFPHGKDHRLAKKVADLLREEEFEGQCFVASLDYAGVMLAKKHNPKLRTAHIVSVALGDVGKLDVDILEVNARLVNDRLLRTAKQLGKEVHVWTVDDRRAMRRWIERGVDNIITNDPESCLEVKEERAGLGETQRLLLACRYLLK